MSSDLQIRRLNSRITSVNSILEGRINDINIEHDGFTLPEEIARATLAESNIQTNLNSEITRAMGVEAANQADIQTANLNITNEITRATAEEAALWQRITDEIATTALDIQTFQTAQTIHNTHVGFRVASTLNNNQSIIENTVLQFDSIPLARRGYCLPDMSSYDTAAREYIIPSDGLYLLGFHVFFNSAPTNEFRLKIVGYLANTLLERSHVLPHSTTRL